MKSKYPVHLVPEKVVKEQSALYATLLNSLRQGAPEEIEAALAARESVEPEEKLSPEITEKLQQMIAAKKAENKISSAI